MARLVESHALDHLCVAFSGGADSSALLILASEWGREHGIAVSAHHVDHGLQAQSASWASFCVERARELGVPCRVTKVTDAPPRGASIEAWARTERYTALAAHSAVGTVILTAHHRDDQAETVLQRAVDAAGPHGLAGIRAVRALGRGLLARPLLGCSRDELRAYLERRGVSWLADPANGDVRFVRNRLRHAVMPALDAALPGAIDGLVRMASLQSALARGLDAYADALLLPAAASSHRLPLARLDAVPVELRPYVVRRFLERAGGLPIGGRHLRAILDTVCAARVDAAPMVRWAGHAVRRYRGSVYLTANPLPPTPTSRQAWRFGTELALSCGRLSAVPAVDGELDATRLAAADAIDVDFRRGGEHCRPVGRGHRHALKKLFQEWGVPPWERARTPLLYVDGELAAVVGYCVCTGFAARAGQPACRLVWTPA